MKITWELDEATASASKNYPINLGDEPPTQQYAGHVVSVEKLRHRLLKCDDFQHDSVMCSPTEMVRCFREHRNLAGLALVVSWGRMGRTLPYIYGPHKLEKIDHSLSECQRIISKTNKLDDAWNILTVDLGWSAVISSKTLHFLCRGLGCTKNPPVAIDNAVMRRKVWPCFAQDIPKHLRPKSWSGKTFCSYNRYMTAILVLAQQRHWTTTQVENTLFARFGASLG
jgi:hypothetical protein